MLDSILGLFKWFWNLLQYPVYFVLIVSAIFLVFIFFNILYCRLKLKIKPKKGEHYKIKKRNPFIKLFFDAPKQIALDYCNSDPEYFKPQGLIIYEGRQGSGKTISMVRDTYLLQQEYPKCKVISNLGYKYQDDELGHWQDMLGYENEKKGVIIQMDEIQAWFSSLDSKNLDGSILSEVCQNRKQRRVWYGTSQLFTRVAKAIREQTIEVRKCYCFFGCINFVHRTEPILDEEGSVKKYKSKGWYFFVQDEELRSLYDTYKVIERLQKVGFKDESEKMPINDSSSLNVLIDKKSVKKGLKR